MLRVSEKRYSRSPRNLGCGPTVVAVGRVCVNEEVLKHKLFLQSAFAFMLDLRESTLAILISAHCGTWLLDLVWKPLFPPKCAYWVQEQPGNQEKGPRKGSSFVKCRNLIVLC